MSPPFVLSAEPPISGTQPNRFGATTVLSIGSRLLAGPREDPTETAVAGGVRHPLDELLPGSKVWSMDLKGMAPRGENSSALLTDCHDCN